MRLLCPSPGQMWARETEMKIMRAAKGMSAETSRSYVVGSCIGTGDTETRTRPYPGILHGLWHTPHPWDHDDDDVERWSHHTR